MSRRKNNTFLFYKGRGCKKQEQPTEGKGENYWRKIKCDSFEGQSKNSRLFAERISGLKIIQNTDLLNWLFFKILISEKSKLKLK